MHLPMPTQLLLRVPVSQTIPYMRIWPTVLFLISSFSLTIYIFIHICITICYNCHKNLIYMYVCMCLRARAHTHTHTHTHTELLQQCQRITNFHIQPRATSRALLTEECFSAGLLHFTVPQGISKSIYDQNGMYSPFLDPYLPHLSISLAWILISLVESSWIPLHNYCSLLLILYNCNSWSTVFAQVTFNKKTNKQTWKAM